MTVMSAVLAHGIGGRQDLPLPLGHVVVGAAAAVVVSFLAVGGLWRTPRLEDRPDDGSGRPLPAALRRLLDSGAMLLAARLLTLAAVGFVAVAAFLGPDDALNPTAYVVYVLFWVGMPFASLVFGPVWRALNPLRTLHAGLTALLRIPRREGIAVLPLGLGYWPSAAGLLAFTWLELVAPGGTSTQVIRLWFVAYALLHLGAALIFGDRWFARCDAFEVYSSLAGRLSVFGRRDDGVLVTRNPLRGLAKVPVAPGLVATVCVLFGSTAYDGAASSPAWVGLVQRTGLSEVLLGTIGLLAVVVVTAGLYGAAVSAAGWFGERRGPRGGAAAHLAGRFAHSLVPIALAYVVAHYLSLLLFEGQQAFILLSDPLGTGANLFGTAERGIDYTIVSGATIAVIQVVVVVVGHILGVVSAHDRAVVLFPRRQAIIGQLPLLILMVCYTIGGLGLLFAG